MGLESFLPSMTSGDSSLTSGLFKVLTFLTGVIGFALCFFGYKLQRIYIALMFGLIAGGVCVGVGIAAANESGGLVVLLGLLGLCMGVVVGYKCFKSITAITYALLGFGITYIISSAFSSDPSEISVAGIIAGILVAAGVGFLVHKFYKPFVIITSALQGSAMCVNGFVMMVQYDGFVDYSMQLMGGVANMMLEGLMGETGSSSDGDSGKTLFVLLLLILGILFQWKTAESKVSDFFRSLAKGTAQAPSNTLGGATINNKYLSFLSRPLMIPNVQNINLYIILGTICAAASLLRGGDIIMLLGTLAIVVAFALLLLQKRGTNVPNLAVNLSFWVGFLLFVFLMFSILANGADIFRMLTPISAAVFLVAFWIAATQQTGKTLLFLVSGGLAAAQLILYMINGEFGLLELAIVLLNLPLMLPALQKYTSSIPMPAERLNNAVITPKAAVETSVAAQTNAVVAQSQTGTVFCAQCGNALRTNAVFCTKCGTKVEDDAE